MRNLFVVLPDQVALFHIFEVKADFFSAVSHRRVRLGSVDEGEHILLKDDVYINTEGERQQYSDTVPPTE